MKIQSKAIHQRNIQQFHSHSVPLDMRDIEGDLDKPITEASLNSKVSVLLRIGLLDLSGGTGTFRVEEMMEKVGAALGVYVRPSVTLTGIEASFSDGKNRSTEIIDLPMVGVNTERIWFMEHFSDWLVVSIGKEAIYHSKPGFSFSMVDALTQPDKRRHLTADMPNTTPIPTLRDIHKKLDAIEYHKKHYNAVQGASAAALACASFTFLLGGSPYDMLAAFLGAFLGQYVRAKMLGRFLNQFFVTGIAAAIAGFIAIGTLHLIALLDPTALSNDAAYIGAMLFLIPGFPLITAGLDIAKLDLLSATQRFMYVAGIVTVAALSAWAVAQTIELRPEGFEPQNINVYALGIARFCASFFGVWGFSILFNSPKRMATVAAAIGAIANTFRLELLDFTSLPPEVGAFIGAMIAGMLAGIWKGISRRGWIRPGHGYPRICLTVPSIVIMVPGLYLYQAMYFLGNMEVTDALTWGVRAITTITCLPIGIAAWRVISDRNWRYHV